MSRRRQASACPASGLDGCNTVAQRNTSGSIQTKILWEAIPTRLQHTFRHGQQTPQNSKLKNQPSTPPHPPRGYGIETSDWWFQYALAPCPHPPTLHPASKTDIYPPLYFLVEDAAQSAYLSRLERPSRQTCRRSQTGKGFGRPIIQMAPYELDASLSHQLFGELTLHLQSYRLHSEHSRSLMLHHWKSCLQK